MTNTTTKRTNILIQRNTRMISAKVPEEMKLMIEEFAKKLNVTNSQYVKLAISERFEKDLAEK